MTGGIYAIEHVASGRRYIGSAADLRKRWREHRCRLRKGNHHAPRLQAAWNKYGEAAFTFSPIIFCAQRDLLMYEQRFLDAYRPHDRGVGFNVATNAVACRLGRKHTPETIEKIKAARAANPPYFSPECRAAMSAARKGRKMPAGFGEAARARAIGYRHTDDARKKMSAAKKGSRCSLAAVEARSKLTLDQAREIRLLWAAGGITQAAIGRRFGIKQQTVSNVIVGKRWRERE